MSHINILSGQVVSRITRENIQGTPEFSVVAEELLPFLTSADLVITHNASIDIGKLNGTLKHWGIL
ncbi:MAG: hypothetical protein WC657_09105 [Candidatus Paceibacterota bacterium]